MFDSKRYMKQKWCPACRKLEKAKQKEKFKQEMENIEMENMRAQQKLFEEARNSQYNGSDLWNSSV